MISQALKAERTNANRVPSSAVAFSLRVHSGPPPLAPLHRGALSGQFYAEVL